MTLRAYDIADELIAEGSVVFGGRDIMWVMPGPELTFYEMSVIGNGLNESGMPTITPVDSAA